MGKKDLKLVKKGLAAGIWYTHKFAIDKARRWKSYRIYAGKSPQIKTSCLLGVASRKISFKESFVLEDIKV